MNIQKLNYCTEYGYDTFSVAQYPVSLVNRSEPFLCQHFGGFFFRLSSGGTPGGLGGAQAPQQLDIWRRVEALGGKVDLAALSGSVRVRLKVSLLAVLPRLVGICTEYI